MPDASEDPAWPLAPGGDWTTVVVEVDAARADLASDRCWIAGAAGVEEQPVPGGVRLLAGFPSPEQAEAGRALLAEVGLGAEVRAVLDDGLDAWKEHAAPVHIRGFVLVPAWQEVPEGAVGDVVLLDSARSFGSGSHPTTQLVLEAIDDLATTDCRVLDVGCGSGVLAIAAALRGATALGIDIDPESPGVTAANAARNHVEDRVLASDRPLAEVVSTEAPFDLVVANLLAPVVRELAADLVAALAPGGTLVISGLLAEQQEAVADALAPLRCTQVTEREGWLALHLGARTVGPPAEAEGPTDSPRLGGSGDVVSGVVGHPADLMTEP